MIFVIVIYVIAPGRKIKIYGIVCPVCKTFVEIDKNKIPLVILNQAARMLEIKN